VLVISRGEGVFAFFSGALGSAAIYLVIGWDLSERTTYRTILGTNPPRPDGDPERERLWVRMNRSAGRYQPLWTIVLSVAVILATLIAGLLSRT